MDASVSQMIEQLQVDPWRAEVGFSPEVEDVHKSLFSTSNCERQSVDVINSWIQKYQPCLFGRIAAKSGLLNYCVLDDDDLRQSDEYIRYKIQAARTQWTRDGFNGKTSGFIIAVLSKRLAYSLPDDVVKRIALRVCSLYLLDDVEADKVYLDEIWLEKPGRGSTIWKWNTGVNYFAAHGDGRWWHDHRLPGGIGFSVNSVGHLVKSGILATAMADLEAALGTPPENGQAAKIKSLDKALELAMRTIALASDAVSGKATCLLSIPQDGDGGPIVRNPAELPAYLADKDFTKYFGYYHTDYTVPSEYFSPVVERPADITGHVLDFTYLFDKDVNNPAYITMGEGRPIRDAADQRRNEVLSGKRDRYFAEETTIDESRRLADALACQEGNADE